MKTESKEDRLVRLFREKVEQMSQEELERKLSELEDGSADEENSGVVSFDYTIKGYSIIRLDMELLKSHGITLDDNVKVILIKK
jgi:hypothetical protein